MPATDEPKHGSYFKETNMDEARSTFDKALNKAMNIPLNHYKPGGRVYIQGHEPSAIDPPHYQFTNGVQVIDISEHLTSNGGQALQYIARSCRLDGNNKGNPVEDLRKAIWFATRELERLQKETE